MYEDGAGWEDGLELKPGGGGTARGTVKPGGDWVD